MILHTCYAHPILDPKDPSYAWMDDQIEADFASLPRLNGQDLEKCETLYRHYCCGLVKHLKIRNNEVSGPDGAGKKMLQLLCKTYGLPDLELFYFQMDGLCETPIGKIPVFTGARKKGVRNTIFFVDWFFGDEGRPTLKRFINAIDRKLQVTPWSQRQSKAFWRGAVCDVPHGGLYTIHNWFLHPRGRACWLSTQYPDLIDAAFLGNQDLFKPPIATWCAAEHREALSKVVPVSPNVPVEEHLNYKYQLYLKGLHALFSRDWQFYSQSVVLRQEMPFEMFWYGLLRPWEHYIPVAEDLSDLIEKILWARAHDVECEKIASQARTFIKTHALPEHVLLYCYKAVMRYTSLFD